MSFTTRCPACGTMFRVVPDQLKISDGWVRCGHCSDVFDAMLNLQNETSPPPVGDVPPQANTPAGSPAAPAGSSRVVIRRTPLPPPPPAPVQAPLAVSPPFPSQAPVSVPVAPFQVPSVSTFRMSPAAPSPAPPAQQAPSDPGWAFVPPREVKPAGEKVLPQDGADGVTLGADAGGKDDWDSDWLLSPSSVSRYRDAVAQELKSHNASPNGARLPTQPVDPSFERELDAFAELSKTSSEPQPSGDITSMPVAEVAESDGGVEDLLPPASPTAGRDGISDFDDLSHEPTFVVQARRDAFWRSPVMRAVLLLLAMGLTALLALQWASFDRDQLAARYPALEPSLKRLCATTGCSLAAPRRIEAVAIDSSTLTRKLGQLYSFDLVVKNSEAMPVAMPALELSLTDSRDKEIARRVFLPQDMPGSPVVVPAHGRLSVSMRLSLAESDLGAMAGYRALVFYP
jgi:predicted Zn finger-like uncharacterized protein